MFRQGNTGTHPNTHCCHAVLDVLFICWIPAQSRSHALLFHGRRVSHQTHRLLFSRLRARLSQPRRVPLVPSPAGRPSAPVPAAFSYFLVVVAACLPPFSFPLLFIAFPPATSFIVADSFTFLRSFLWFSALILFPHPSPLTSLSCLLQPHPPPPALGRPPRPSWLRSTDSHQRSPRSLDLAQLRAQDLASPRGKGSRAC